MSVIRLELTTALLARAECDWLADQNTPEAGLVREVGRSRGDRGPSAVLYELNPTAGWVVGIDVGRIWVRAAIADIAGTIRARRDERAKVSSAKALIGQIGSMARRLAAEAGVGWAQVTHAALGSPGVFDPAHGYVAMAPSLPGWGRHGLVERRHANRRLCRRGEPAWAGGRGCGVFRPLDVRN